MIPEIKTAVIGHLQQGYRGNKAPELHGTAAYSDQFFQDWQEKGIVPAYQGLVRYIYDARHLEEDKITLKEKAYINCYALGVIGVSTVLSTGLTQYVQMASESQKDSKTLQGKIAMGVYSASLGILFTAKAADDEVTYGITRRGDRIYPVAGTGHIKEKDLNDAMDAAAGKRFPW